MPKFHPVAVPDASSGRNWTIEQITPGEKPIPIVFFGSRKEVGDEVTRLNGGGKIQIRNVTTPKRTRTVRKRLPVKS